ncbi:MAG: UDP-N-acetylglucosamine--N-acetylmuramyl-(pentapeptide) pyrophosphoryl-undecaprenol N-acetylglucosamine transferase [Patescibacteria group bacterium]|nr:UDP-N-acetylglucosamine--N-acetylmuramyl-(pentapeptide) pyrophosphoryl-undecaprenol N-acetylglucosamine transferase [Patescibacteria group bacterium]
MESENKKHKILLTGGGTGGSVAPLLAVAEELNPLLTPLYKGGKGEFEFLWLGTKFGPEREMVEKAGIEFKAISGGKWRRYFSFKNLADIIKIKLGFFQSLWQMLKWRPDLVISAGSFISVPIVWAAWVLRVPILIHQQDIIAGLANKLMAPFAKVITVTFEKSLKDYGKKAEWTGNPVRRSLTLATEFKNNLPVILIVGGGTGAVFFNKLTEDSIGELTKFCQVIHITGKDRGILNNELRIMNYAKYEFLNIDEMAGALKMADIVVTRAGLGILSELSYLKKPAIIIPMPDSHQEANAEYFKGKKAAIVIGQKDLTAAGFTHMIKDLLADEKMLGNLAANMKNAMKPGSSREMVKIINKILDL